MASFKDTWVNRSPDTMTPEIMTKMLDLFVELQALFSSSDLPVNVKGGVIVSFALETMLICESATPRESESIKESTLNKVEREIIRGVQAIQLLKDVDEAFRTYAKKLEHNVLHSKTYTQKDAYDRMKLAYETAGRCRIPDRETLEDPTTTPTEEKE